MIGNDFGKIEVILLFLEFGNFDVVWDIVATIFGGNLFEVAFMYLRLGRLLVFLVWESLVQNLTLFINWSKLFY